MRLIQKILNRLEHLMYNRVSIISTLYFNFHHLPFSQAKKVVSGNYHCSERSIIMGNPAIVVAEGKRYMDIRDCSYKS